MYHPLVIAALDRLHTAADKIVAAFPLTQWTKVSGPGPDTYRMNEYGQLEGMQLQPGCELIVRCQLDLPESTLGIPLEGQTLEATLFSLYPTTILWNNKIIFSEGGVPVAAGPALFTLIPKLATGNNGNIEMRISVPKNQVTKWFQCRLTTPLFRRTFERLDIAWAQLALAHALAVSDAEQQAVLHAAEKVPHTILPIDDAVINPALDQLVTALKPLSNKITARKVHLIGHSHIDLNWLWTLPDTVEVIKRDFASVIKLMDDYPELTFSHSQPATYDLISKHEPELFKNVLRHIASGRWEPIGMTWVEGDLNMAGGEGHARQLLLGTRYSRDVLGFVPTTLHEPDTFGHPGNVPQLAVSAGAARYYHHRCNQGQENQWPAYWWEGQDGSRLLAISTYSYNGEITARDLAKAVIRAHSFGHSSSLHFHGIGDHGGGPSRQNLDALRRFNRTPLLPRATCSTLAAYTRELLDSAPNLPVHQGESTTIFEGCYTTHADTKRYNRMGENLLCTADTLTALAGLNHNPAMTLAWKKILFNQFHDILDGSAIHEAYEENRLDFEQARSTAMKVSAAALDHLQSHAAPGQIAVTNPLSFDRQDWVELPMPTEGIHALEASHWLLGDNGHETPFQRTNQGIGFVARVPAYGTVCYRWAPATNSLPSPVVLEALPAFAPTDNRNDNMLGNAAKQGPYLLIETAAYRVYLRRDCGIICSYFDKQSGRELVGFGMRRGSDYIDSARPDLAMNVFQVMDEHPHGMSAWQLHEVHREESLLTGATTTVVETGPARCVVQIDHKFRSSTISQKISFYRDLPFIEFNTAVNWREIGDEKLGVPNLKVAFNAHLMEAQAWFETPFAAVQRPADGQEVPALRWADVGGDAYGIALLNDSKYGCDALGNRLRLSLLRSGYDPDAISDIGQHEIRYALFAHCGNWRDAGVVPAATAFNQPLLARYAKATPANVSDRLIVHQFALQPRLSGSASIQLSCLKISYDGTGCVMRLYESAGRTSHTIIENLPPGVLLWELNIVEDKLCQLELRSGSCQITMSPWQVRTILIDLPRTT